VVFGIRDRGVVQPGAFADLNVIDVDGLALDVPELLHDFPTGAARYVQRSRGYAATVVNGVVFVEGGSPTGARVGRTLRS
jgi:N-acyl-D-aspartate/D-glutamate deacylase